MNRGLRSDLAHPAKFEAAFGTVQPSSGSNASADGFSLLELIVVVGIVGVMLTGASILMPSMVKQSKADAAVAAVLNTLRLARDRAIGDRRNMRLIFTPPKHIQVVRQEIGGGSNTTIADLELENTQQFLYFTETGDTLDGFGLTNKPVAFGPTQNTIPPVMFTSEGTLVDSTGDPINGTLFFGTLNDPSSARAVTIFGATALLRSWRWDGKQWTQ